MVNDPITKIMRDASEIVRYDEVGIPLSIREGLLSATCMKTSNGCISAPDR